MVLENELLLDSVVSIGSREIKTDQTRKKHKHTSNSTMELISK